MFEVEKDHILETRQQRPPNVGLYTATAVPSVMSKKHLYRKGHRGCIGYSHSSYKIITRNVYQQDIGSKMCATSIAIP